MLDALTPWHLALILLAFVLLIGYKKLPDASRSLGRSLRIFKSEVAAMRDDEPATPAPAAAVPALPAPTADELEEQARAEEARAARLRARLAGGPTA